VRGSVPADLGVLDRAHEQRGQRHQQGGEKEDQQRQRQRDGDDAPPRLDALQRAPQFGRAQDGGAHGR
jgi:hypothetical protein